MKLRNQEPPTIEDSPKQQVENGGPTRLELASYAIAAVLLLPIAWWLKANLGIAEWLRATFGG